MKNTVLHGCNGKYDYEIEEVKAWLLKHPGLNVSAHLRILSAGTPEERDCSGNPVKGSLTWKLRYMERDGSAVCIDGKWFAR